MKQYGVENVLIECPIHVIEPLSGERFDICIVSGQVIFTNPAGDVIGSGGGGGGSGSGSGCCCAPLTLNDELVFLDGDVVMVSC